MYGTPATPHTPAEPVPGSALLDALGTAVLSVDTAGKLTTLNTAAETLLGISRERALGNGFGRFLSAEVSQTVQAALDSGRRYTCADIELTLPGHRHVTVDCLAGPCHGGVVLELRDRSERVTHEHVMDTATAVARESLQQLAHEIRNPLVGIDGAAQLLERETTADCLEHLGIIRGETARLSQLLERMLSGARKPQPSPVNIHQVLDYVLRLMEPRWPPGLRILRKYDPSLPLLDADRDQLVQVFLNLIHNAREVVTTPGQITLRTRAEHQCTIGRHRTVLRAEVIDTGPGLPPDMKKSAFFPMVSGRKGGSGLGLGIAQSLIRAHGGTLEYSRLAGRQETVFAVLLPFST